jgi:hypothetical protein
MNKYQKKLYQYFNKNFARMKEDLIEWFTDKEDDTKYIWEFKYQGAHYRLSLNKTNMRVASFQM